MKNAALVTGGAVRLGKALATGLARRGYDIALHYHSSENESRQTCRQIEAMGVQYRCFRFDLRDFSGMENHMGRIFNEFPGLSVLVNSASAYMQTDIDGTTPEDFDRLFDVNLKAPFFLSQLFARQCAKGNIINILDNKIAFNQPAYAAYLLTKKGLAELTKLAALSFAPTIRVNGIAPGVVLPAESRSDEYIHWRIKGIPLERKGDTGQILDGVLSLLENEFVTGQVLAVDGGESITNVGFNSAGYDQTQI